ncbi:MAG TPA: CDP-diacylglycerol--glycerol-3-phosphate 3-phosphatidyltransferase [Acidimicrobiales bacterium]
MTDSFGKDAIATPANAITLGRILLSPLLFWMVLDSHDSWPAVSLWIILSVTDWLDGYYARRHGTTRSGAFLDPLADKILVLGTLFVLVADEKFWLLPVAIIAVREAAISAYRSVVARQGITVPARTLAKIKTVAQEVAIGFALLPLTAAHTWVANSVLWASVVLTVVSGGQYFLDANRVADDQLAETDPASA